MSLINKSALMALIQPLTGLGAFSVIWEHDPEPPVNDTDFAKVTLLLKNWQGLGVDEHRYAYVAGSNPPTTATYTTMEAGNRNVVLQLKAEAYNASAEASDILESVRVKIHAQVNNDALSAIGLDYQYTEATVDLPTSYDERVVSCAVMEIHFGVVSTFSQTQTGQGWIDTVNGNNVVTPNPPLSGP